MKGVQREQEGERLYDAEYIWIWEYKSSCVVVFNETKQELSKAPFFRDFGISCLQCLYTGTTFPKGTGLHIKR